MWMNKMIGAPGNSDRQQRSGLFSGRVHGFSIFGSLELDGYRYCLLYYSSKSP